MFFSLSARFYGLECEKYLFFICQHSLAARSWSVALVPQSKRWKEALEHRRDPSKGLATLEGRTKLNAAVVQRDFPVWISLHREGKAPLQPSAAPAGHLLSLHR